MGNFGAAQVSESGSTDLQKDMLVCVLREKFWKDTSLSVHSVGEWGARRRRLKRSYFYVVLFLLLKY